MQGQTDIKPARPQGRRLLIGFLIIFSIIEAVGLVMFIVRMMRKG